MLRGVLYFCIATAIAVVPLLVAGFFIPPLAGLLWSIAVGIIVSTSVFLCGAALAWSRGSGEALFWGVACVLLVLIILLVAGFWIIAVAIIVFFWITFLCADSFYSGLGLTWTGDEWIEEKYDEMEEEKSEWVEEVRERLKKKRK